MKIISVINRVWNLRPAHAALIAFLLGGVLIPLSLWTGVAHVSDPTAAEPRESGFMGAVNWSVMYGILFPVFVFMLYSWLHEIRRLIDRLARWGMVIDAKGVPVRSQVLQDSWQGIQQRVTVVGLVLLFILCPLLLLNGYAAIYVPDAAHGTPDAARANMVVSFYACSVRAVAIVFVTHFVWFSLAFAMFLDRHSRANATVRIVPNVRMAEEHMGLHVFSPIILYLVLLYTSVFGLMFMVRLWQIFLRSDHPFFAAFLRSEYAEYLWPASLNRIPEVIPNLFHTALPDTIPQAVLLVFALSVPITMVSFVLLMIERAIYRGKRYIIRYLPENIVLRTGQQSDSIMGGIQRLESLSDWPLEKVNRNQIFAFTIFLVFALFFYRLALVLAAVLFFLLAKHTVILIDSYISSKK